MYSWEDRKKFYDKEYYDDSVAGKPYANWWWTDDAVWRPRADIIVSAFNPVNALVCGCAKGSLVKYLCARGVDAVGVDLSQYAINTTPFPEVKHKLFCHDLATELLPYPAQHFDVVTAFDILEHQDDEHIDFVVSEIARVAASTIMIRQPFLDTTMIPDMAHRYVAWQRKEIAERMADVIGLGARPYTIDTNNLEHPNTRPKEIFIEMFPDFRERELPVKYYDIEINGEPVLPFFDTLVLERIHYDKPVHDSKERRAEYRTSAG